jgi:hypothetical protein
MVDDDYALRVVLEELRGDQSGACLHWSEKISSLWDDLPFLQGVNLQRGDSPISVTWLDRVNSYVSYSHVLGSDEATLVLLQPSIACSPLHAIVSLIGLLVLMVPINPRRLSSLREFSSRPRTASAVPDAALLRLGCPYRARLHLEPPGPGCFPAACA